MQKQEVEQLYTQNVKKIYKFFYLRVFDIQTAEDLTSDTFMAVADYIYSNKEINNPNALLYKVAANVFNQHLRRKYKEQTIDLEVLETYVVQEVEDSEAETKPKAANEKFMQKVANYIKELPKKQAQILNMRLIQKKSLNNIADELKKDLNYVKTTQRRGIAKLKEFLIKHPFNNVSSISKLKESTDS